MRRLLTFGRVALGIAVTAAFLPACAGSSGSTPAFTPGGNVSKPYSGSWMAPNSAGKNLLYVSDYDDVLVFDYATNDQVGKLTGFSEAYGSCTDAKGDVFVTNYGAADVLEFAHAGTKPIKTFIDPSPYAADCSVDPTTGDLAVVNQYGKSEYSAGNVAIFPSGKGNPKVYSCSCISTYASATYDNRGDLLASGFKSSALSFAILDAGSGEFKSVNLAHSGQWSYPGYVRWDGLYFDVEYQVPYYQYPVVFMWYTIKGTTGTREGYMLTEESGEGGGPFWLGKIGGLKSVKRANQLAANIRDYGVLIWNYPRGGSYIFDLDEYGGNGITASLRGNQ
jgi:hypothetical protein